MNQNKLKTSLSIAAISKLSSKYKFFTIEKTFKKGHIKRGVANKTLTKVLAKHLKLSKYLNASNLKYPLIITFFKNSESFFEYLNENSRNNTIVFMSTGSVVCKQNLPNKISSLHLFQNFSSLFTPSSMLLKCLKLAQKSEIH